MNTKILFGGIALLLLIAIAGVALTSAQKSETALPDLDATPKDVTLSGTYTCLPHLDTTGPQTEECMFGLKTDGGDYYAVNFGESANAADLFQSGAHVTAQGNIVIKEALSSDHWQKYNMKGIFTVTKILDSSNGAPAGGSAKINIDAVCEGALAYMSFPDGASAEAFVKECKEGKHPEVIEQYKAQLGTDGAAI